jgi:regulatory protein
MKRVKAIEKVKQRYRIVTNETSYLLEEDTLVHFRLAVGKEFTDSDWKAIERYDDSVRGLQQAYRYLSFKPRSVAQIKEYLRTKEVHDIEAIVKTLKEKGYLDDQATAQWILEQTQLQKKGNNVARQKMIQAKIHPSIIDELLAKQDRGEAFELAFARGKKSLQPTTKSLVAYQASLLQKLTAAGFSYEVAKEVLDALKEEIEAQVDEAASISKWLTKNHNLPKDKQIQKLMQQGFAYRTIQSLIDSH